MAEQNNLVQDLVYEMVSNRFTVKRSEEEAFEQLMTFLEFNFNKDGHYRYKFNKSMKEIQNECSHITDFISLEDTTLSEVAREYFSVPAENVQGYFEQYFPALALSCNLTIVKVLQNLLWDSPTQTLVIDQIQCNCQGYVGAWQIVITKGFINVEDKLGICDRNIEQGNIVY